MKEAIYLILQDIQTLIEKLKQQEINQELQNLIQEAQNLTSQINKLLEENKPKEIYKKILQLKTLELKIIFQDIQNTNFYKFWETLIENIKKNLITSEELYQFYKEEINKLMINAEIVSNILIMEDEDIIFKTFIDIMFGEAFKNYYNILQKLHQYIFNKDITLLEEIRENIPSVVFYLLQIQKLIPQEYSENVDKIIQENQ